MALSMRGITVKLFILAPIRTSAPSNLDRNARNFSQSIVSYRPIRFAYQKIQRGSGHRRAATQRA
jgi:hypothetical protein